MGRPSPIKIFSGTNSQYFAEKLCAAAKLPLGDMNVLRFSDGEFTISYEETIRGSELFLVQSTFPPSDNLMELLLMIDAAKRASAKNIIAVIPYFGFARQDRKDKPRIAIGAKLIADMLTTAGVDRIITMDLHADQIQGFFNVPVDHLFASTIFVPYIISLNLDNLVIASPDVGGSKRANTYSKNLNVPMVLCHKTRPAANVVGEMTVIGDVKGKNVVIIDDMADTAGTLTKAADLMMEQGATSVRAMVTHAVFSGPAYDRIRDSKLHSIICTDSIPIRKNAEKVTVLSIAELFADTIHRIYNQESISSNYIF